MLTQSERRGLSVLVLVLALGAARDLWMWQRLGVSAPVTAGTAAGGEAARAFAPEVPPGTARPDEAPRPGATADAQPRIDVNRAPAEELDRLPGIGPVLAGRIREHRSLHGPFDRPEDLLAVQGIGPRLLERLRPRIRTTLADSVATPSDPSGGR